VASNLHLVCKQAVSSRQKLTCPQAVTAAYSERSCFLFTKSSRLRRACVLVSNNKIFENFIFLVIVCNCVTLALSSSRQGFDDTALGEALSHMDYVFIAIFTVEMLLKVVSMGFVLGKGTYLRDGESADQGPAPKQPPGSNELRPVVVGWTPPLPA
jgi:hypothetical protein